MIVFDHQPFRLRIVRLIQTPPVDGGIEFYVHGDAGHSYADITFVAFRIVHAILSLAADWTREKIEVVDLLLFLAPRLTGVLELPHSSSFLVSTLIRGSPVRRSSSRCSAIWRNCRSSSACCFPVCSTLRWLRVRSHGLVAGGRSWWDRRDGPTLKASRVAGSAHTFRPNTDCRPFREPPAGPDPRSARGLFFDARTPATRSSHMVRGAITQLVVEFVAATANRFWMQAGDFRDLLQAAVPATQRRCCSSNRLSNTFSCR